MLSDTKKYRNQIIRLIYDEQHMHSDKPSAMPQKCLRKEIKKGYNRHNPVFDKIFRRRLEALAIKYIESIILDHYHSNKELGSEDIYVINGDVDVEKEINAIIWSDVWDCKPEVIIIPKNNKLRLFHLGYSDVGTKFEKDLNNFNASTILRTVYSEIVMGNDNLICWLMLSGKWDIFSSIIDIKETE